MNDKQRKVLWITAVVLLLMLLFPPFETPHYKRNAGYGCIANPPKEYANVNVATLFIQCLIGGAVGGICWFAYKDEQKSPKEKEKEKEKDNT